ncbi:MAG: helix-turn-helix domain-containing protein [Pseudonocardiaceae bacterium]
MPSEGTGDAATVHNRHTIVTSLDIDRFAIDHDQIGSAHQARLVCGNQPQVDVDVRDDAHGVGKLRMQLPGQCEPGGSHVYCDRRSWSAVRHRPDVRRILAALDIGAFYRVLDAEAGLSQRQIAARSGQSQSEVSEIVSGRRRVENYHVLARIAERFGIPREFMGLSWWSPDGTYCGEVSTVEPTEDDVRRRTLIGATSVAALGQVVQGLGELTELALPTGEPLPSRLGMVHVHTVEAVTGRLRGMARQFGGQADLFVSAARYYARWMQVPAPEVVKARLGAALAELYTEAGWCCYDAGLDGTGCFTRAQALADEARDAYSIANAAWHAGTTLVRGGHPDDALKCFQLGQLVLAGFQPGKARPAVLCADDPRVPVLARQLNRNSASAYVRLGKADQVQRYLNNAQDGWVPRTAFEQAGADCTTARIQLELGRLNAAEVFAANAVCNYGDAHFRFRTIAELVLAEVHVRAGEPRGLVLAQQAVTAASTLQSVAVRGERLLPLAAALEARPGNDAQQLARTARHIAAPHA